MGTGYQLEELGAASEGYLAQVTYFRPGEATEGPAEATSLTSSRNNLERNIAELKSRRPSLPEEQYFAVLERLFVSLARLNERIEAAGN